MIRILKVTFYETITVMIGYLEGTLLKIEGDRILLLANQVGYEILIPSIIMDSLNSISIGEKISLYIYFQQTERQPKPVLIGFNNEEEKEFFQNFISVGDIGPLKAVKAMNVPISEIANAIEAGDSARLKQLKGIGDRTAQKIIAALSGKMDRFALSPDEKKSETYRETDFAKSVLDVLISKLGHKAADANKMISAALKRNSAISTAEELIDEVFKGET